mgnify:CR=1 FL=1
MKRSVGGIKYVRKIPMPMRSPHLPVRRARAYAAGTANAQVSPAVVGLDGTRTDVAWDAARDEYLAHVVWSPDELLIVAQPRDQRALRVLRVDPDTGDTTLVHEDTDPHWVEIVPGVPARTVSPVSARRDSERASPTASG